MAAQGPGRCIRRRGRAHIKALLALLDALEHMAEGLKAGELAVHRRIGDCGRAFGQGFAGVSVIFERAE
jgi:hypothetical protein